MIVEPTEIEFEASEQRPHACVHCRQPVGYHWQTAEGKLFCTREVAEPTANNPGAAK